MNRSERFQQIYMLSLMQQEFENITHQAAGVIVISVPGTSTKHVYSDNLATKISRAIARTLEQERSALLFANHQSRIDKLT